MFYFFFRKQLDRLDNNVWAVYQQNLVIMKTQADLQTSIETVSSKVDEAIARIAALPAPTLEVDLTPQVEAVEAIGAKVDAIAPAA